MQLLHHLPIISKKNNQTNKQTKNKNERKRKMKKLYLFFSCQDMTSNINLLANHFRNFSSSGSLTAHKVITANCKFGLASKFEVKITNLSYQRNLVLKG